jgi:hypothetical protein
MIPLKDDNPNQSNILTCSSSIRVLVYHTNSQQQSGRGDVVWYAYIGGFVAGLLFARFFTPQRAWIGRRTNRRRYLF